MNWNEILNSPVIENLGWTLLHSVWQIAFVAFFLFIGLKILAKASANTRCLVSLFALVLSLGLPISTFVWLSQNSSVVNQFGKDFIGEGAESSAQKSYPPENLSPVKNSTNTNTANEIILSSVGNFQSTFAQNFSALAPFLVGFWIFGMLIFAFRFAGGVWQLRIYKTRETFALSADWQVRFKDLCERLNVKQTVEILQSKIVETPMVIGWLKPVILVPTSVILQINPRELETILAHELIHIRRCDYLINLAQGFIEILFFYHPCVWWISGEIRRERECACDDAVTEILEDSRFVYANALTNLEELRLRAKTNTTTPLFTAANGGNLMNRIQRIIGQKNTETSGANSLWTAGLAFLLISALLLTVFSSNSGVNVNAQIKTKNRKLAIGFVSIPPLDRTKNAPKDADATARLLIEKLKSHKIPAIGFVQGSMISDGEKLYPVRANIVRLWRDAGLEIGIGNFKHVWFYHTPYEDFVAGVEKNEAVVKKILAEKNLPLGYFSYPFLNTGKSAEERNRFEIWLQSRGLSPVKYTIDNQEWMYSYAYDMARNDNDINTMSEIRAEFLNYMRKMFDHYEAYSQETFGRDIAQTMVLTPSRLITDSADELFGMIKTRGYKFVSMDEALADEAYQTPENFFGKAGISWFERWTMMQGRKLRDEPSVSKNVQKIWEETRTKK
ncbi:MAG TPA: M56 family metallopeptidase [Pyrinomonadaceae bacterium]|nr:M56 family metallopeptidase [Pyrinomonadaceae bacterium]